MDFPTFCADASASLCRFLVQCQLVGADAGQCEAIGAAADLACTSESASKVATGRWAFLSGLGEACLGGLADAGCDALGFSQVNTLCASSAYLVGNTLPGGTCYFDSDCLATDAGPSPLCDIDSSVTCTGFCTLGATLGAPCQTDPFYLLCAPGQGTCTFFSLLDDAGAGSFCAPFPGSGAPCSDTDVDYTCDGTTQFCGDAGAATNTCQPYALSGSSCDPQVCAYPAQCLCPPGEICLPDALDSGGTCGPLGFHTPCLPLGDYPCGLTSACELLGISDGGTLPYCTTTVTAVGAACDGLDGCDPNLVCNDPVSGICTLPGGLGESCNLALNTPCANPLQCLAPADGGTLDTCQPYPGGLGSDCRFTAVCGELLSCAVVEDGGAVCVPQAGVGALCTTQADAPCASGFCAPPSDAGVIGVCTPFTPLGQPCSGESQCEPNGHCYFIPDDGGGLCGNVTCTD